VTAPAPPAPQPRRAEPAQPAPQVHLSPYVPAGRSQPEHAAAARPRRSLAGAGTPGVLQLLLFGLVAASIVWGAVGAWTVSQHASAASEVVSTSEPLSLAAQQMYQSLSDADVTANTAILAGPPEQLSARLRYEADIANAAADLAHLRGAVAGSGNGKLTSDLTDVSTALPVYAKYAQEALNWSATGQPLTAGSYMQTASDVMHLTLLPAANAIYAQQSAALTAASSQATGLPWIVVTVLLAIAIGFTLLAAQRWLRRRTHRLVNYGLLLATAAILISTVWLVAGFLSARSDFTQGLGHGSTPAEELAQSVIAAQQARADQVLNLISRTGSTSFSADYTAETAKIGPRPRSLLTTAQASSLTGTGAAEAIAAERSAAAWYSVSAQVFQLDNAHQYAAETALVIGTGSGSSGSGFTALVGHLRRGISADQAVFKSNAAAGSGAFGGLEAGVIIAALLMAAGSAWGLSRRLAEYR
jgi:hypothetical protein